MARAKRVPGPRDRVAFTLTQILEAMVTQAICPKCGKKLGHMKNIQTNHNPPLALRHGERWAGVHPNDPRYLECMHIKCHDEQTRGHAPKATTYGSDIHAIAKTKRLHKQRVEREATEDGDNEPQTEDFKARAPRPKSTISSRGFQTNRTSPLKAKIGGGTVRRDRKKS